MHKQPFSIVNQNLYKLKMCNYFSQLVQFPNSINVPTVLKYKLNSILSNRAFLIYKRLKHQLLLYKNSKMRIIGRIYLRVTRSNIFLIFTKNNKILYSLSSGRLGYKKRQRRMSLVVKPLFLKFISKLLLLIPKYKIGPLKFIYIESSKYNNQFLSMLKYKLNMFIKERLKQMSVFAFKRLVGQFRKYKKKNYVSKHNFTNKFIGKYGRNQHSMYNSNKKTKRMSYKKMNQFIPITNNNPNKKRDRRFQSPRRVHFPTSKNKFIHLHSSNSIFKKNNTKRHYKDNRLPFLFLHGIHDIFEDRMSKWTRQELRNFIIHGIDPDEERRKEEESKIIEIEYVEKPKGSPSLPEKDIIYVESGKSDPKPIIEKEVDEVFCGEYHFFDPENPESYKLNKPIWPEIITEEMVAAADAKAAARAQKKKEEESLEINKADNLKNQVKTRSISDEEWKKLLNVVYVKELNAEMCSAVIPIDILLQRREKLLKKMELKKKKSKKTKKSIMVDSGNDNSWKKGGGRGIMNSFSKKKSKNINSKAGKFKQNLRYKNFKKKKKPKFKFLIKMFRKRILERTLMKRRKKLLSIINLFKWWLKNRNLLQSVHTSPDLIHMFVKKFKSNVRGYFLNKRKRKVKPQYRSFRILSKFKYLLPVSYQSSSIYKKKFSGFFSRSYKYNQNRRINFIGRVPVKFPVRKDVIMNYASSSLFYKKFKYYRKFLVSKRRFLLKSLSGRKKNLSKLRQNAILFSNSINFLKKFIGNFEKNSLVDKSEHIRSFVLLNLCRILLQDLSFYKQNSNHLQSFNSVNILKRFLYRYSQLATRSLLKIHRRYLLSLKGNFTSLQLSNHLPLQKLKKNIVNLRRAFKRRKDKYKKIKYLIRGGRGKNKLSTFLKRYKSSKSSGKKKVVIKKGKRNKIHKQSLFFYKKNLSKFSLGLLKREISFLKKQKKSNLLRKKILAVYLELKKKKYFRKIFKNFKFNNAFKNIENIEEFSLLRTKEDFKTILDVYKRYTHYYKFRKLARKSEYRLGFINFLTYFIFKYGPLKELKKKSRSKFLKKIYYFLFKSRKKIHQSLVRRKLKSVRSFFLKKKFGKKIFLKLRKQKWKKKHRILFRKFLLVQAQPQKFKKYSTIFNHKKRGNVRLYRFKKRKKKKIYRKRQYPLISKISRYETKHGFVNAFKKKNLFKYFKKRYIKIPKKIHLKFLKAFKLFYIGSGMLTHILDKTSIPFGGNPRSRSKKEDRSW